MTTKLRYSREELLADPAYARRIERDGVLFHGGLDEQGRYLSARSLHRRDAIRAWTEQLAEAGAATEAMRFERSVPDFFPSVAQAKLLLRTGARSAMTRILTLIGADGPVGRPS
jgi:hypothetical protein